MANISLFKGLVGIFRIFTLVFGLIVLVLTAYFFDDSARNTYGGCFAGILDKDGRHSAVEFWRVLLAIVIITLIGSLIWIVLFIFEVFNDSRITKIIDTICHIMGGVVLIIAGILWLIAEIKTKRDGRILTCSKPQVTFIYITGIAGIIDGCVYLIMGFLVWKSLAQVGAQPVIESQSHMSPSPENADIGREIEKNESEDAAQNYPEPADEKLPTNDLIVSDEN